MNISTLQQHGYKPIKKQNDYTIFKSNKGIVLLHDDGNSEGFIKTTQQSIDKETIIKEGLRQNIEMFILIASGILYFTTDITIVDGVSMEPTYKNHQVIVKSAASKKVDDTMLNTNAVIKFKSPTGETSIKRIVGTPGDEIEFDFNVIRINGEVIDVANSEPHPPSTYQKPALTSMRTVRKKSPISVIKLKPGEYFVMGDNKSNSTDSRAYGQIKTSAIISIVQK